MKKLWYSLGTLFFTFICVNLFLPQSALAISRDSAVAWAKAQGENNAKYDLDKKYDYQCSDFSSAFMNYLVDGNAYSGIYDVYMAYYYPTVAGWNTGRWEVIKNYAAFLPEPGDIFVSVGLDPDTGHTGVVISSDVNNAWVVDQNWKNQWDGARYHYINWSGAYAATYYIRYKGYTADMKSSRS